MWSIRRSVPALVGLVTLSVPATWIHGQGTLRLLDRDVPQGARSAPLVLRVDLTEPAYGFQLSLVCDPDRLRFAGFSLAEGVAADAEFSFGETRDGGTVLSWGVVLDVSAPFDINHTIPPGEDLDLGRVLVDVVSATVGTTEIRFEDRPAGGGAPASVTQLVGDRGVPIATSAIGATATIVEGTEPLFVRGNSNGDRSFDLSDGVFTLNWLFGGGTEPRCMDAADTNDNGSVDLSDAVYSFNALFSGGPPPPPPYPLQGPDPTADGLTCLVSED